jgi:Putative transposase
VKYHRRFLYHIQLTFVGPASCTYRNRPGATSGVEGAELAKHAEHRQAISAGGCAPNSGFSLHAAVRWGADQRQQLEHLCRYITRPAIANERLKRNGAGQVVLQLKSSYKDGTTHIVMSPQWSMSKTSLSSLTQLMRAELRRRLEDHRRHRRSGGDC